MTSTTDEKWEYYKSIIRVYLLDLKEIARMIIDARDHEDLARRLISKLDLYKNLYSNICYTKKTPRKYRGV